jgi:hypothetical protein
MHAVWAGKRLQELALFAKRLLRQPKQAHFSDLSEVAVHKKF